MVVFNPMASTAVVMYYLSEHPAIVGFWWSHIQSWGATWCFLFSSIAVYLAIAVALHLLLSLTRRRSRPLPLGPIPVLHSLFIISCPSPLSSFSPGFSSPLSPRSWRPAGSGADRRRISNGSSASPLEHALPRSSPCYRPSESQDPLQQTSTSIVAQNNTLERPHPKRHIFITWESMDLNQMMTWSDFVIKVSGLTITGWTKDGGVEGLEG